MDVPYTIIYKAVKNPRLEFKQGNLQVVIPQGRDFDITAFFDRHKNWITKQVNKFNFLRQQSQSLVLEPKLSEDFQEQVLAFINEYAKILNSRPRAVRFRTMRSRWGSCTGLGVITINLKLRYFPPELVGYVIFHEMIHLTEKNHGTRFYKMLSEVYSDYKKFDSQLRVYEFAYQNLTKVRGI